MSEKRKFIRHNAIHLLDYLVLEDDGTKTTYSMGRTIDVSAGGIKLETAHELEPGTRLEITVGLEEDLVDLIGTIVYCREKMGRYISGIAFEELHGEHKRVYQKYVDAFLEVKKGQNLNREPINYLHSPRSDGSEREELQF
ncbi:PilZ domain-containing protein [Desulfosediminicola ganghwensis]|uniref:PilZ domain-containing protein n=1 Tax=Desulfosediminicola ganghwensis TaxID=2569540 RepID=UPI0010AB63AE|nr:PilZ domain-containing protein [Desulfosediminicola ganghwensis]